MQIDEIIIVFSHQHRNISPPPLYQYVLLYNFWALFCGWTLHFCYTTSVTCSSNLDTTLTRSKNTLCSGNYIPNMLGPITVSAVSSFRIRGVLHYSLVQQQEGHLKLSSNHFSPFTDWNSSHTTELTHPYCTSIVFTQNITSWHLRLLQVTVVSWPDPSLVSRP